MKNRKNNILQTIFIVILLSVCSQKMIFAQDMNRERQDSMVIFWNKEFQDYPYSQILRDINYSDTLFYCKYPPRFYRENKAPIYIDMFLYVQNGTWKGTIFLTYIDRKYKKWDLLKPMWIFFDLTEQIGIVIEELNKMDYTIEISGPSTSVFIKWGEQSYAGHMSGNIHSGLENMPALAKIIAVGFFETYNLNVEKKYKKKTYRHLYGWGKKNDYLAPGEIR